MKGSNMKQGFQVCDQEDKKDWKKEKWFMLWSNLKFLKNRKQPKLRMLAYDTKIKILNILLI